jgi:hypothetical protein
MVETRVIAALVNSNGQLCKDQDVRIEGSTLDLPAFELGGRRSVSFPAKRRADGMYQERPLDTREGEEGEVVISSRNDLPSLSRSPAIALCEPDVGSI